MRDKPHAELIVSKANTLIKRIGKVIIPDEIKNVLKTYGFHVADMGKFKIEYNFPTVLSEFQKWLSKSDFSKGEKAYKYLDTHGKVFRTVSMAWPNKDKAPDDYWIPLKHPITGELCPLPSRGWRNPTKTMDKLLGNADPITYNDNMVIKGEIAFTRKKNGQLNIPERIYYLEDNMKENVPSIYNDGTSDDTLLSDLNISFPYPKTISVASYLIKNIMPSANLILDFFAGSGTTLHATMQLNAEDGGHRKCILVTNNENNICEEVTYERNKRVIQGYTTPKGEEVEGLHDNNLRYYRTNFLSRDKSVKNMRQLVRLATDMLCIKNDVYTEAEFCGKKINPNIARYFDNGQGNRMLVIYEERAISLLVQLMAQTEDDGIKTMVYVFSPGVDPYTDDFEDIAERVKLCALPSAIYEAYKRVLPKRKPKFLDEALQEMKAQAEAEANMQQTLDFGENDNMNEEGGEA